MKREACPVCGTKHIKFPENCLKFAMYQYEHKDDVIEPSWYDTLRMSKQQVTDQYTNTVSYVKKYFFWQLKTFIARTCGSTKVA